MSSKKKYYKSIDLIRVFSCITILLYHLNILKGGYLAVCTFFVLSGYLSCVSAFKRAKFSLLEYYKNRVIKIYLPLLIVVFISIFIISFFPNINWFNLKPETTSVLLGYNNFWQLSANLDYFARHVNSPFIHLWYIAILLQFDFIFPFIFLLLKKIGEKFNELIPCIICVIISIIFSIYFYNAAITQNIMTVYYNSFTRVFSLLFGVSLGFIHSYYKPLVQNIIRYKLLDKIIFYSYILILLCLFIFVDANSIYFPICMILSTIISCRLIDYSVDNSDDKMSIFDKIVKSLSGVIYEIYLIQYPIIFLFQEVKLNTNIKIFLIVCLVVLLSYILHFALSFKNEKYKLLRKLIFSGLIIISIIGGCNYFKAKDYTQDMKELEAQLANNQKMAIKMQEEYQLKLKQEEDNWAKTMEDLENGEKELSEIVKNLSIVGIGDSVMLGAVHNLYKTFPNGYFDAQISRTAWVAGGILSDLKVRNMLGDAIVLNLGANGDCSDECKRNIMNLCGNRDVFWVNVTNDGSVNVNNQLKKFASNYSNLHIIDWQSISKGHSEYFIADGIHLTDVGINVYTQAIYDSIYNVYLKKFQAKKEELLHQREEQLKSKISFYGNDILLNAYDYIRNDFEGAKFIINKEFNYDKLRKELKENKINDDLTNNLVFVFDELAYLNSDNYIELIKTYSEYKIYIVCINNEVKEKLNEYIGDNVTIINFYDKLKKHNDYLMPDKIHLTKSGNKALNDLLQENIK